MKLTVKKFQELTTTELYEILKARAEILLWSKRSIIRTWMTLIIKVCTAFFTEDKKVIAYLRAFYQENDGDIVRIGRVLTLQHGNGTGRDLLEQSLKAIKENMKCKKIVMDAQKYAVGFYEKFGFKTISDDFYEEGILHVVMELDV